jgi:prepilin-type N-terminal cleavage/methylation domain-containing protein
MGNKPRKLDAFTLVELLVVMVIIALLVALAIPSARALRGSCESTGAQAMISSAFSSARAMAAKEHRYVGVRFQKAYDSNVPDANNWPQYMIFIISEEPPKLGIYKQSLPTVNLVNGYKAVEGLKPIKLPDNMGVMDLKVRTNWGNSATGDETKTNDIPIDISNEIVNDNQLRDTTSFSILFSPTGKLIIHDVRIRNKDGKSYSDNTSNDEIFNTRGNVTASNPIGRFIQDDYADMGLGAEMSRSSFVIYDREKFKVAYKSGTPFNSYLKNLTVVHINQYTGTMIEK